MAESTAIAWTDHTFNPWQGCAKVSPACDHCYAESLSKRVGHPERWGVDGERAVTSDGYWRNPLRWDAKAAAAGRPSLVFCASMADVFEDRRDLDPVRERLWELIARTPNLIWQLLTKRPENIYGSVPLRWTWEGGVDWPTNVWVGTTVEDQASADLRIPHLIQIPAPVRFLSCEPLLERVSLRWAAYEDIGWVIVGGESGGGFRPLDVENARVLRDECERAGVPFFFKQHGGLTAKAGGHLLDGVRIQQFPPLAGR